MLVADEQLQNRHIRAGRVERTKARTDAAVRENRQKADATSAPDGQHDVTNLLAQMGKPLHSKEVITRLKKMNSNLHFEVSNADNTKTGIYLITQIRDNPWESWKTGKRFICGMGNGFMPERSVRHTETEEFPKEYPEVGLDRVQVMKSETRGWRTVLAKLLRERIITKGGINRYFPAMGQDSRNWQMLTT